MHIRWVCTLAPPGKYAQTIVYNGCGWVRHQGWHHGLFCFQITLGNCTVTLLKNPKLTQSQMSSCADPKCSCMTSYATGLSPVSEQHPAIFDYRFATCLLPAVTFLLNVTKFEITHNKDVSLTKLRTDLIKIRKLPITVFKVLKKLAK